MGEIRAKKTKKNGFSLLEIMVALALWALSFSALLLVQARATRLGVQARNLSMATQLARYQLMECKREAQKIIASASDFKLEGDFSEMGFEKFSFECHAPKFNMKTPSDSQIAKSTHALSGQEAKKQQDKANVKSAASPILGIVTDTLGNSVRELAVIIRWSEDEYADEVRVVTHIVDLSAMQALNRMLAQGLKQLQQKAPSPSQNTQGPPDAKK